MGHTQWVIMTTIPFGTGIVLSRPTSPGPTLTTPTVVGVIGLLGAGATAAAGSLYLAHNKAEMLALVGSDGELNRWAEEYYQRNTGLALISPMAAHDAADDSARGTAASNALNEFLSDVNDSATLGVKASIIDIHDYGTNAESGSETAASTIVAAAEAVAEIRRAMVYANFPAASATRLSDFQTNFAAWLGNNRKPRVLAVGGWSRTAANNSGIATSTTLASVRAALDGSDGIAEPLHNKPVSGYVGNYPNIPYVHNRNATLVGRTLQNLNGGSFIANYVGWKTVIGELATANAADNKRYESILRCVDVAEDTFERTLGSHIGTQNSAIDQTALLQELKAVASALKNEDILEGAAFNPPVTQPNDAGSRFIINLTGSITTAGIVVQINLNVEVN